MIETYRGRKYNSYDAAQEARRKRQRELYFEKRKAYLDSAGYVPMVKKAKPPKAKMPGYILSAASFASGIELERIFERVRYTPFVKCRMMIFYYLFTQGVGDSAAAHMCGYDRTTVRYLRKLHDDVYKYDSVYKKTYDKFVEVLNAKN